MASNLLEKNIEKRFFNNLINQKNKFQNTSINIYQKLVFMRYLEVIKNSLPLFLKYIDEEEFENSVRAFMKDTPKTPFVWQIPNDYRKFVKKIKLFDNKKYLYELLYYDWIEIEIYMKEYKLKEQKKFSYNKSYYLSKSTRVKRFKYDIIGNDYTSKRENFLVIYYDFKTNDVLYREINQIIYILLQRLNKKQSIIEVLKDLCKEHEVNFKDAKKILEEPLKELYLNMAFS